jgi:hypothetical protein
MRKQPIMYTVGTNPGSQPHRNVHIREANEANEAATCHLCAEQLYLHFSLHPRRTALQAD